MQQIEKIVIGLFIEQSLLNFEPIEAQNFNRLHGSDAQILIVQLEGLVDKIGEALLNEEVLNDGQIFNDGADKAEQRGGELFVGAEGGCNVNVNTKII